MPMKAFKRIKKQIVYPTINSIRRKINQETITCIEDTDNSITFELGEYDPETHRRASVPSFHLDYLDDGIRLIVNETPRITLATKNVTEQWLREELCQWLSHDLRKRKSRLINTQIQDIPRSRNFELSGTNL